MDNQENMKFESVVTVIPSNDLSDLEECDRVLLELKVKMTTSSMNHEYARQEFGETEDRCKREDLLSFMNQCRDEYFESRKTLKQFDSLALEEFETDLIKQKQKTFQYYHA